MSFQKSVLGKLAFGVAGEMYDDSPRRVSPMIVGGTAGVTVGNFVRFKDVATDPTVCVGYGTGSVAGIVVAGKQYVTGGLDASMAVGVNSVVDVCTMGHVVVSIKGDNSAVVGETKLEVSDTDGSIAIYSGTASDAGYTALDNARVVLVNGGGTAGLCVIELN